MTKEEVLQRANDYCNERSYDSETLTDEFKDKFADFFVKRHPDAGIDDDGILDEIKFNLDTARSASVKGLARKQTSFESKESDYKRQIKELNERLGKKESPTPQEELKIPKELQDQLDELKKFKNEEAQKEKFKNIIDIAKQSIREDLHKSFEAYTKSFKVSLDKEDKEQADNLVANFQEIFKDSIGDIKPLAPKQVQKRDDDFLASLPKIKV